MIPTAQITVDPSHVLNRIMPAMYGACIEDVNHEIYGGLYAQRIFGESFEEPAGGSPKGWVIQGGDWTSAETGISVRGDDGSKCVRQMPDFSDGIVEAANTQNELFGFERLSRVTAQCAQGSIEAVMKTILDAVEEFSRGAGQADDLTLLIVRYRHALN